MVCRKAGATAVLALIVTMSGAFVVIFLASAPPEMKIWQSLFLWNTNSTDTTKTIQPIDRKTIQSEETPVKTTEQIGVSPKTYTSSIITPILSTRSLETAKTITETQFENESQTKTIGLFPKSSDRSAFTIDEIISSEPTTNFNGDFYFGNTEIIRGEEEESLSPGKETIQNTKVNNEGN